MHSDRGHWGSFPRLVSPSPCNRAPGPTLSATPTMVTDMYSVDVQWVPIGAEIRYLGQSMPQ